MAKHDVNRIFRPITAADKNRRAEIRAKVMQEFPSAHSAHPVETACDVGSAHSSKTAK